MTVEDIYRILKDDQVVTIMSDKFSWRGESRYIPTDYMEIAIVNLSVCDHVLVIDLGSIRL